MKLHLRWTKRLAILTIGATVAFAGGVIANPHATQAASSISAKSAAAKADSIISLGKDI